MKFEMIDVPLCELARIRRSNRCVFQSFEHTWIVSGTVLLKEDNMRLFAICILAAAVPALFAEPRRLLVISVDGLDARYLNEPDRIGVKIPNLRRLRSEGMAASGVVGIVPT